MESQFNEAQAALEEEETRQKLSEQLAIEKGAVENEARDKETLVLSLKPEYYLSNIGIVHSTVKFDELERAKRQLQGDLDEFANNQGTADLKPEYYVSKIRIVHELEKAKKSLEFQLAELKNQYEKLELQLTEATEAKLSIFKRFENLEAELDEERKQRAAAVIARKKLEGHIKKLENQVELQHKVMCDEKAISEEAIRNAEEAIRHAEEAIRGAKKAASRISQRQAAAARDELAASSKEAEREEPMEEINSNNNKGSLLIDEKRRLEARIASPEEELEEEQSSNEMLGRAREAQLSIDQAHINKDNTRVKALNRQSDEAEEGEQAQACEINEVSNRVLRKCTATTSTPVAEEEEVKPAVWCPFDTSPIQLQEVTHQDETFSSSNSATPDGDVQEDAQDQIKTVREKASRSLVDKLKSENEFIKNKLEKTEQLRLKTNKLCSALAGRLDEIAIFFCSELNPKAVLGSLGVAENRSLTEIINNSLDVSRSFNSSLMDDPEQSQAQLINITALLNCTVVQKAEESDCESDSEVEEGKKLELVLTPKNTSATIEAQQSEGHGESEASSEPDRAVSRFHQAKAE